jgi:hypothetical protein
MRLVPRPSAPVVGVAVAAEIAAATAEAAAVGAAAVAAVVVAVDAAVVVAAAAGSIRIGYVGASVLAWDYALIPCVRNCWSKSARCTLATPSVRP